MTIDRAVARKNKDWGNIQGWIPRLATQGLYDDYVETKHCQDQTLNDWGRCLGLPHTGYGPDCRKYSASMIWLLYLNNEWIWISVFALN